MLGGFNFRQLFTIFCSFSPYFSNDFITSKEHGCASTCIATFDNGPSYTFLTLSFTELYNIYLYLYIMFWTVLPNISNSDDNDDDIREQVHCRLSGAF